MRQELNNFEPRFQKLPDKRLRTERTVAIAVLTGACLLIVAITFTLLSFGPHDIHKEASDPTLIIDLSRDYDISDQDLAEDDETEDTEWIAMTTLLRMNGVDVTKDVVINRKDVIFETDNSILRVIKSFIPVEKTVVDISGTNARYLPTPCMVLINRDCEEGTIPIWIVVTYTDDGEIRCIDPLVGPTWYPMSKFERSYMSNGSQAYYIANRGHDPEM